MQNYEKNLIIQNNFFFASNKSPSQLQSTCVLREVKSGIKHLLHYTFIRNS